jgi:hypothetical protein
MGVVVLAFGAEGLFMALKKCQCLVDVSSLQQPLKVMYVYQGPITELGTISPYGHGFFKHVLGSQLPGPPLIGLGQCLDPFRALFSIDQGLVATNGCLVSTLLQGPPYIGRTGFFCLFYAPLSSAGFALSGHAADCIFIVVMNLLHLKMLKGAKSSDIFVPGGVGLLSMSRCVSTIQS